MYEWSAADLMIRDSVREFTDKHIRPNLAALERGDMLPYPIIRKLFADFGVDVMGSEALKKDLERQRTAQAGGQRTAQVGEPRPGEDKGNHTLPAGAASMAAIAVAELAGACLGIVASAGVSVGLAAAAIKARGTLAQQKRWLPDLVTFDRIGAWAITEPDSGSDAFGGMTTHVIRDGDDYILNGQKTFTTNGPHADVTVVYAKLDDGSGVDRRERPVLAFVLDKGMPGFTQGPPFHKMGMNASPTGELFFDDVRLGRDRLLGETETHAAGDGRASARSSFTAERVGVAVLSLGIIDECHRLCVDYARNRRLWGQEIGRFQLIQLKLAQMEIARLNVQNMVFNALEAAQAGKQPGLAEASAMKIYSSQAATDVAMEAVQLFGGNGYMAEYRVEQLARDAMSLMIYAGSNEIQVTHVAKGLLGST